MEKYIIKLYYLSLLLPALSLTQSVLGIYLQNRILWLPIGFFLISKWRKLYKFNYSIFLLLLFGAVYCFIAFVNGWNILIYWGYFLTLFLLLVSNSVVYAHKELFLFFFKQFFILNACYVAVQLIFLNVGLSSFALIHTNLPMQINEGYAIPVFIHEPFYRYTGLFNESSPFAFYLCICFCFFTTLGVKYKLYRNISFVLLLFSGAKIAYFFFILYMILAAKSKVLRLIFFSALVCVTYLTLFNLKYFIDLTGGEAASIDGRLGGFGGVDSQFSFWGNGLGKSSEGEVALDMFSILLAGFGVCGMLIIYLLIVCFYLSIKNSNKRMFILPFVVGALSSGSLLIIQYSLLSYCLVYLHSCDANENK